MKAAAALVKIRWDKTSAENRRKHAKKMAEARWAKKRKPIIAHPSTD